jgi:hypothetical protein
MTQPNLLLVRKRLSWLQAMREPQRALGWSLCEWERVVRLARPLRLLARLAEALDREQLLPRVAPQPRGLLIAAQRLSADRLTALRWAADRVLPLLEPCTGARVLLKGAAYVAQGLPIAHGRLPSDLDLMVPQAEIGAAQQALRLAGWQEAPLDEHDRRYYPRVEPRGAADEPRAAPDGAGPAPQHPAARGAHAGVGTGLASHTPAGRPQRLDRLAGAGPGGPGAALRVTPVPGFRSPRARAGFGRPPRPANCAASPKPNCTCTSKAASSPS